MRRKRGDAIDPLRTSVMHADCNAKSAAQNRMLTASSSKATHAQLDARPNVAALLLQGHQRCSRNRPAEEKR